MSVAIVASGGANIASLQFALERLGATSTVTADADVLRAADRVLLPGVGAAGDAMARLERAGLTRVLPQLTCPVLGICLGMQLLFESSEEGDARCLGVLPGRVRRLPGAAGRPVPHMGWNTLNQLQPVALLEGLKPGDYVYFVHSFAAPASAATVAATDYGTPFSACVSSGNFHGAQFHPERSAAVGARLLRNFLALT